MSQAGFSHAACGHPYTAHEGPPLLCIQGGQICLRRWGFLTGMALLYSGVIVASIIGFRVYTHEMQSGDQAVLFALTCLCSVLGLIGLIVACQHFEARSWPRYAHFYKKHCVLYSCALDRFTRISRVRYRDLKAVHGVLPVGGLPAGSDRRHLWFELRDPMNTRSQSFWAKLSEVAAGDTAHARLREFLQADHAHIRHYVSAITCLNKRLPSSPPIRVTIFGQYRPDSPKATPVSQGFLENIRWMKWLKGNPL